MGQSPQPGSMNDGVAFTTINQEEELTTTTTMVVMNRSDDRNTVQ